MTKNYIFKSISALVTLIIMIFVLNYAYQSWQLSKRGFPLFCRFLDIDMWHLNEENLSAGKLDYTEESQAIRESMVTDLIIRNKNIYVKRSTLVATLGKSLSFQVLTGGRVSLALLDNNSEMNITHRINSRSGKIYDISGLNITKEDVIYIAGRSASGVCILIFFYNDSETLIDCAWIEEQ